MGTLPTLQHPAAERFTMVNPWLSGMLLAFEASEVVRLRLMKIASGGDAASDEAHLMISEKVTAAFEAFGSMLSGRSAVSTIERYREHVAANALRLNS
jgi:hypothetical protein